jgi:ketosteroid isomerase-like protein
MSEAADFMERFQRMWRDPTPKGYAALFHPEGHFQHPSMEDPVAASQAGDYMRTVQSSLPDIVLEVRRCAASEDSVLVGYTLQATVAGRSVSWDGADRFTLRDGQAIEGVAYFDTTALQRKLAAAAP